MKAFKDGAFQLAVKTGAPIFPVVLSGTAASLPKQGLVLRDHVRSLIIETKRELDAAGNTGATLME